MAMSLEITLDQRVALVTGAGSGIGRACALALAQCGAEVYVNDIQQEVGLETVRLVNESGGRGSFLQADVASPEAVEAMAREVSKRSGHLHILVNNAGFDLWKRVGDMTYEDWDRVMSVHLRGMFGVTRAMIPLLEKTGNASVVNVASVHAIATEIGTTAYAAAKGGIVAMTRAMALDLGPQGVRVNSTSPGYVQTPLLDEWLDGLTIAR
jgi:NAD(P)-dependent dehydrogenase (short-subunit alcohol dehydrogenase family)